MTAFDPFTLGRSTPLFDRLLRGSDVTLRDALVYGRLAFFRGKGPVGECRPSLGRVAADLGMSERDVRRHVRKLEQLNLIRRVGRAGRPNMIEFVDPGPKHPGVNHTGGSGSGAESPGVEPTPDPGSNYPAHPGSNFPGAPVQITPPIRREREQRSDHLREQTEPAKKLRGFEERWGVDLVRSARDACACKNATKRMTDSAWVAALTELAKLPDASVIHCMRTMVADEAMWPKGWRYMLGIARNHHLNPPPPRPIAKTNSRGAAPVSSDAEHTTNGALPWT